MHERHGLNRTHQLFWELRRIDTVYYPASVARSVMTTHLSLRRLTTFGNLAAEDDAVLKYFLTTDAVPRVRSGEILLALGRKGSGKTALVRHFTEGDPAKGARAVALRAYPWGIHQERADQSASQVEAYVTSWRYLIAVQLASLLMAHEGADRSTSEARSISEFFLVNYGGLEPDLGDVLRPERLKLSKSSFEPTVFGNKLGGVTLERGGRNAGRELGALTDALLKAVTTLGGACGIGPLFLHFDELDQGLTTLDEPRKNLLIGLVLAARAILRDTAGSLTLCVPVVYLRTDLWEDLKFSDKNKITQSQTLHLEWSRGTLLKLVNERLTANLSVDATWEKVAAQDLMRGSQTKWDHILARTFFRPRDVIQFLNVALVKAKLRYEEPLVFDNKDIAEARETYSTYLKHELDDEIIPHWEQWEDALRACSAIATITFQREQFTDEYEKRVSSGNSVPADEALRLMYRFSVIGYQRPTSGGGSEWNLPLSKSGRWMGHERHPLQSTRRP
jgi:hypothetical protein